MAVVTGLNGAGKSHLLEIIAHSYDALKVHREMMDADFEADFGYGWHVSVRPTIACLLECPMLEKRRARNTARVPAR